MKKIEIPFGASDSEDYYQEIIIPDGLEAIMEDGKIILRKKETEDDKIIRAIIAHIKDLRFYDTYYGVTPDEMVAWLEKQAPKPLVKSALKESEDERIRTFLHHTFTEQYLSEDKLSTWHGEAVVNILSWLEKQEQVKYSAISLHENKTCKENDDSLTCKIINALCTITKYAERELGLDAIDGVDIEDICYWLKKQGQTFPILSNSSKIVNDWTEEDDYNVRCCIAKAESDIANGSLGRNKELIEWLKSLKQRLEQ